MDVRSPFFQNIATVLVGVMFLNPIVSTAADLAVDAPPVATPASAAPARRAGGQHRHAQRQRPVPQPLHRLQRRPAGLILNNATDKLQNTQLGGYIIGNANLNGRAAGLILNEVSGGSPSQLKGYTEVAGQGAHVIVANPTASPVTAAASSTRPRSP